MDTLDLLKAHISAYTRKDGAQVKAHEANLSHPAYNTPVKLKGYNFKQGVTATQALTPSDAAKVLVRNSPEWTKGDHRSLSDAHHHAAKEHEHAWNATADEAAQQKWGRNFEASDYQISGIGSDEFSHRHKEALREHAHARSKHLSMAAAHAAAAHSRMTKE